ncbi:YhcN/YlaJ family sporulation lipoprotein [Cohnella lubricantis]|uniref:YhcN/YlaJ family sporulation lipoprotein n=1 Tax=Cohnella lubricantis TaxID=2163172 RepID=A0A841TFK0_9BACL|nr:YhcN/YlaJ family sporulation lipoprotein [Cohnella lubricantis]MBB6679792.1 YhcN/YlaJ family sporulation lipoprotein [Cohnella lubricantis]MBP2120341.1 hypothetical protein [Cohnella lubricantis]
MRKGAAASSIVLSTALALTGCMANQGDLGNKNIRPNSYRAQNTRFAQDGLNETNRINGRQQMNNNIAGLHQNANLELSQDIADRLSSLPEIKSAYVALTNNNAYVAVVEDRNGNGSNNAGNGANGSVTPYSTGATPRDDGSTNPNVFRSHYSADGLHYYHKDQISSIPQTGMHTRSKDGVRGLSAAGDNDVNGNGISNGNANGNFGNGTTATDDIADDLKSKVADIVKGMNPAIDNVYVSANADFYGRMQNFSADVAAGHPIQAMITQFNALVERIFPENAGTGTTNGRTDKIAPHYYAPTTNARPSGAGTTH